MISKNIFYFSNINIIGGVESFFYYMVKKYKDYDITIYYKTGDMKQIQRLRKYARVIKFTGQKIQCEKAFFCYNADIIDSVIAKEYIQIIHANYVATKTKPHFYPQITKVIGVSQYCCDKYEELTGVKCECVYNPLDVDIPEKPLILVSATRLTEEKGKDNMLLLDRNLYKNGRPYIWFIFTNDTTEIVSPNIAWLHPRLDISNFFGIADFVVQLSKDEAYGYVPNEALKIGTPVILTDLKVYKELGIKDGEHGFVINDFENFDVNKLYDFKKKISYNPPEDKWGEILAKGENTYLKEKKDMVTAIALEGFSTKDFDKLKNLSRASEYNGNEYGEIYKDDIFDCDKKLFKYYTSENPTGRALVKEYSELD